MKHFAFLILAAALFVNITLADPNENGILGRFKRARRASPTVTVIKSSLSTTMKNFAVTQLKALAKGKRFAKLDDPDSGLPVTIRNAMKKKFGGNWFVLGCEADEFCGFTLLPIGKRLTVKVNNGQSIWFLVAKLS